MMHFFKNKKILVTGHTGFKGSWLCLWLQEMGATVIGFALQPPTKPNMFDLAHVADGMVSIIGDIRDYDALYTALKHHQPEIVIHMAAQPLVLRSYSHPIDTYATNVMGTVNLFEAIRQAACVKTIVNVTTDKCYENKEWHWGYRESERLGGYDPYSNSKACAELVTTAYRQSYFTDMNIGLASARAGNVIGGGDWADNRLIPDIIQACIDNTPVAIRHPDAIRPWQHVLEPLSGYLLLAQHLHEQRDKFTGAWNFGPEEQDVKPVSWITDFIVTQWGNDASWFIDHSHDKPHEATHLKLDISKAKTTLGWKPRWNLSNALEHTIEWYQAFAAKKDLQAISREQILRYMNL